MTKSEEYRRKAEEAERNAEHAKDSEAKRIYRGIAANWRELATYAERHNR